MLNRILLGALFASALAAGASAGVQIDDADMSLTWGTGFNTGGGGGGGGGSGSGGPELGEGPSDDISLEDTPDDLGAGPLPDEIITEDEVAGGGGSGGGMGGRIVAAVPEPGSLALIGAGLIGLGRITRRKS